MMVMFQGYFNHRQIQYSHFILETSRRIRVLDNLEPLAVEVEDFWQTSTTTNKIKRTWHSSNITRLNKLFYVSHLL